MSEPLYLAHPLNPLIVPRLSGVLQHHEYPCPECSGDGTQEHPVEECNTCDFGPHGSSKCYHCEVCENCQGEGKFWFGCWYHEDEGECFRCKREAPIACNLFEGPDEYVCLPCYMKIHREQCGCDLWAKWEAMVMDFEATGSSG